MLDIHALHVFYEAARARSFTAAAHNLNMTQPAVSMQIKTLEDYLQVKLFERHGRTVNLTKAGQALLPRARQLLDMSISTEELIRTANDEVLGNLTVACSLPSASQVLIQLAAQFQWLYPLVKIHIPTVSKGELVSKVTSGQFDFGVMNLVNQCDMVECVHLFDDHIVLIAPVNHPFDQRPYILPSDLTGQPFVCQGKDSACRYAVRDALLPYGVDPTQFDVRMEINNHMAIISAVEHGVGLAFVSRLDVEHAVSRGNVRIIPIQDINLSTSVGLVFSSTHISSLASLKFKAYITHPRTRMKVLLPPPLQTTPEVSVYA